MKGTRKPEDTASCPLCKVLKKLRRVFYGGAEDPFVIVMNTVRGTPMLVLKEHRGELRGPLRTKSLMIMNEICRKVYGKEYYLVKGGARAHWWVEGRPLTVKHESLSSVKGVRCERHRKSD